jgi:glycosyltransferase involved in cell wall biosynthesis
LISIVIPTLNEAEGIKDTINSIPIAALKGMGFEVEVLVVDGGSRDGTDRIAKELGARVVYEFRRGYGRAYKTGFKEARGDIIITLDGDASYPSECIPQLLNFFVENNLDMLIAQRNPEPGAMSLLNAFGNYVLTTLIKLLFHINIRDSQSGMWIIRRDVLKDIMPKSDGMEFSEEIKIRAYLQGKRISEFLIPYRKRKGKEKLKRFRDGLKNFLYIFVLFLHSRFERGPEL